MERENRLNIVKRIINGVSMEWCPDTGERLSEPHGINGEGQRTCPPCDYTPESCWLADEREKREQELMEVKE